MDYGKIDSNDPTKLDTTDENYPKLVEEVNELLAQEVEVKIDKVRLPETISATCDKCSHNMDKALEIEPSVLMTLGKLVEV